MRRLIVVFALCLAFSIDAECPVQSFVFFGSVVDSAGAPVPGATVICTLDGDKRPATAQTDLAGNYTLTMSSDTQAGKSCSGEDKCRPREEATFEVEAIRGSGSQTFKIPQDNSDEDIEVPAITVK